MQGPQAVSSVTVTQIANLWYGGPYGTILLPGDIEASAERRLLVRDASGLAANILVAPHHVPGRLPGDVRTLALRELVGHVHQLLQLGPANRAAQGHPTLIRVDVPPTVPGVLEPTSPSMA